MAIQISRILHAGYLFKCGDTQIAFDPIFENPFSINCYAFPEVKFDRDQIRESHFDAVFISHFHDDHCSLESLDLLDRQTPIYIYCLFEELFSLIKDLGFKNIYSLEIDASISIGPFKIVPRRALDSDVDSIFHIEAEGLKILNVVDSWIDLSTLQILAQSAPWDLVLWPFQTMREIEVLSPSRALPPPKELPAEWMEQLKILNPRYIVPSSCQFIHESWSWYNHSLFPITYRQFQIEVEAVIPDSKVVRLNPSVTVILNQNSLLQGSALGWVQPIGEQNVDYKFDRDNKALSTAEIAKHFAPLTNEQAQRVYEYCQVGLLEKFRSLEQPEDIYFSKSRFWRLSIYDHNGEVKDFCFRIDQGDIQIARENDEPCSWLTEVSISKFYAALECGESLSSMYMRINDMTFEPEVEREIQDADVIDDPLIRCLFHGVFGAYQRAQLRRIRIDR